MRLYLTRDKDNALVLSNKKLGKQVTFGRWDLPPSKKYDYINLPDAWFTDVKWVDDEPTKVALYT